MPARGGLLQVPARGDTELFCIGHRGALPAPSCSGALECCTSPPSPKEHQRPWVELMCSASLEPGCVLVHGSPELLLAYTHSSTLSPSPYRGVRQRSRVPSVTAVSLPNRTLYLSPLSRLPQHLRRRVLLHETHPRTPLPTTLAWLPLRLSLKAFSVAPVGIIERMVQRKLGSPAIHICVTSTRMAAPCQWASGRNYICNSPPTPATACTQHARTPSTPQHVTGSRAELSACP